MKCPHLADWLKKVCDACKKPYTPSSFQLSEYCKSYFHSKCPLYLDNRDRAEQNAACSYTHNTTNESEVNIKC